MRIRGLIVNLTSKEAWNLILSLIESGYPATSVHRLYSPLSQRFGVAIPSRK